MKKDIYKGGRRECLEFAVIDCAFQVIYLQSGSKDVFQYIKQLIDLNDHSIRKLIL